MTNELAAFTPKSEGVFQTQGKGAAPAVGVLVAKGQSWR